MEAIFSALKEEKKQTERLFKRYHGELNKLPKGSFFTRKRGEKVYCYLTYSVGGEIRQDYLGILSEEKIKEYKESMLRKKKLKELIQKAEKQKSFLEKALRYAREKELKKFY